MENRVIQFDDGSQTLALFSADGPTIKWYPNDTNFVDRLARFVDWLNGFSERMKSLKGAGSVELDETGKPIKAGDDYVVGSFENMGAEFCAELDKTFAADISAVAFARVNPISPTKNGSYVFENFLDAVMPYVEQSFDGFKESRERYTARFLNREQRRTKK